MQFELINDLNTAPPTVSSQASHSTAQYGCYRSHAGVCGDVTSDLRAPREQQQGASSEVKPRHTQPTINEVARHGFSFEASSERPFGLKAHEIDASGVESRISIAGQRIADYENAAMRLKSRQSTPASSDIRVVKSGSLNSDGAALTDFPNEILTQILAHLNPDSHASVALLSKRFYALVSTPHAWRAAFFRYFPGQYSFTAQVNRENKSADRICSEFRYFSRLSALASWRSEYLLRVRLLRSLARGKPRFNGIGSSSRSTSQSGQTPAAVLTYNTKLPWSISNVHAVFSNGKKPHKVIHGTGDLGVATISDPSTGRVEKWGLDDPVSFAQFDAMAPTLKPYGLDSEGPAAVPNIMDVSSVYGYVGGEGFPGGRVFYRPLDQSIGLYLGHDSVTVDVTPWYPRVPQLSEAVCTVWIAKSTSVPSLTQFMVGIMTGSSLGIVTAYAVRHDAVGTRYASGEMTARWVLSPGVPIVGLKVDDNYNQRKKSLKRVWAVALNALGEVFYLTEVPGPPANRVMTPQARDAVKDAWQAGRSVHWEIIERTRRKARQDALDNNADCGTYSLRSSADAIGLSKEQIAAEVREIETFLRHPPAYFRKVCEGWDMLRTLEVDFARVGPDGPGESLFAITAGHADGEPASVIRYTRQLAKIEEAGPLPPSLRSSSLQSIFGCKPDLRRNSCPGNEEQAATNENMSGSGVVETSEWAVAQCSFEGGAQGVIEITATALDASTYAVMASFEDPLCNADSWSANPASTAAASSTPTAKNSTGEVPGRRARFLAVGTSTGDVFVWNGRQTVSSGSIDLVRSIHTESPKVTSLAVSALYLVHGGSDGLVQAWDVLCSCLDPIRTLNTKYSRHGPRHIIHANQALRLSNYPAVGAIFLDPNPVVLRGVLVFGTFVRFWSYGSTNLTTKRKRRARHSDAHGRVPSRHLGQKVSSYIAVETAELCREEKNRLQELKRLRNRFGVGGDLTEEEEIRYAKMVSKDSFMAEEQRRQSFQDTGDTGSAADMGVTASLADTLSVDTVTREPSLGGGGSPSLFSPKEETGGDFEAQLQHAIRLSLLERDTEIVRSPRDNRPVDYEFQLKVATKDKNKGRQSSFASPATQQTRTPAARTGDSSRSPHTALGGSGHDADTDLALALRLSLEEEESRQMT